MRGLHGRLARPALPQRCPQRSRTAHVAAPRLMHAASGPAAFAAGFAHAGHGLGLRPPQRTRCACAAFGPRVCSAPLACFGRAEATHRAALRATRCASRHAAHRRGRPLAANRLASLAHPPPAAAQQRATTQQQRGQRFAAGPRPGHAPWTALGGTFITARSRAYLVT